MLTPEWLNRNLTVEFSYSKMGDEYLPGKALWLTKEWTPTFQPVN